MSELGHTQIYFKKLPLQAVISEQVWNVVTLILQITALGRNDK